MNKNVDKRKSLVKRIIKYISITIIIVACIIVTSLYLGNRNARLWINKNILKKDIGEEELPSIELSNENANVFAYGDKIEILKEVDLSINN